MAKETLEDVNQKTGMGNILISVYKYLVDNKFLGGNKNNPNYTRIVDESGYEAFNTVFGESTIAEREDSINIAFHYNNGEGYSTKQTLTGTGTTANLNEMAQVKTGTGIGTSKIKSRRAVRYITRHECLAMFTSMYTTPEANTYQSHLYGERNQDGIGFGYNGTVFGIWIITRSIIEHIPQDSWSEGLPSGFVFDPLKLNIFCVSFGWLGIAPISFKIFCGKRYGWKTVHIEDRTNNQDKPYLGNATLPISVEVGRTSGTGANLILSTASWGAGILGKGGKPENRYIITKRENTTFSGTVYQSIMSFKSKETYQSKTNNIRTIIGTATFSNLGNKDISIDIFRDNGVNEATLTGGSYVDADTNGSPLQYNNTATTFVAGAGTKLVGNTLVQPNTMATRINLLGSGDAEIDIVAGETIHIVVLGANTGTLKSTIRMVDEF